MYKVVQLLNSYFENNAQKLHEVVNKIFNSHYGGIVGKDIDEFYGIATDALIEIWEKGTYDPSKGKFDGYVYRAVKMAIIDEYKKRNRDKRTDKIESVDENGNKIKVPVDDIRLDDRINEESCLTYKDMLPSDFTIEKEAFGELECLSENVMEFLESLSEVQKKITRLIMKGYAPNDIQKILSITEKQYKDCWSVITSYDKKRILYKDNDMGERTMNTMVIEENVTEKYKNTSYSIDSISKQLQRKRIRDDHILQRHSGQWKGFAKSELVSDILRGKSLTQIIISEEIKDGIKMQWLIDGKQRCTTLDDYLHDGFPISKNVKNYNITYQTSKVDENGNEILNNEGFTDMEWRSFDIRGKKFSQLPEELQDIFRDRQIPVLYNMDCTKKDIADDIARFNRSRPMNKAQNGWLGLEEGFAEFVENIAKMQFFQPEFPGSTYTKNNNTSGVIRRIIVESIMVSDFMDDFGDFDKMCEFLSDKASDSDFTEFYSLVERLTPICNTKEIASLFDAKDSFLWFGLFSRFVKLGLEDEKFVEFMNQFNVLRTNKLDGTSFDDILQQTKSTKDKGIVIKKMNHLKKLMNTFLGVKDYAESHNSEENFIAENLNMGVESVKDCMDIYKEDLDVLLENTIKFGSRLLEPKNRPSLLAMIAYSYKEDVNLDEWLTQYAAKNNTYLADQRKNFLHMKQDFEQYLKKCV